MRAIKFIKNGEEHYIGDVSKEYVDKKTEDRQVKFFSIPTVGDSIKSLWEYLNNYKDDEEIQCFIDSNDFHGWGWKHRIITSMTVDYSTDGPFGTIIAEGNGQVMYIKYSTIAGEPDVDTYCDSIEIEDACKVKFFPMPQVGDNLSDIITSTMAGYNAGVYSEPSYLVVLRTAEDDTETTAWESRWIVQSYTESTQDPSFLVATHNGTRKKFYFNSNRVCTSIVDENSAGHYEDLGFANRSSNTLVINSEKPAEGTMVRISFDLYSEGYVPVPYSLSFDGGESSSVIRCSGDPSPDWFTTGEAASLTGLMTDAGFVVLERDTWNYGGE